MSASLRELIDRDQGVFAPLALNPLMARLAESAGFEALYLGGGQLGYEQVVLEANFNITDVTQRGLAIRTVTGFQEGDFTADEATPINPLTTYAKANGSAEDRARVWGPEYLSARHYLRIYIRQLREKLEVDPALPTLFKTEWGSGYALSTTGAGPAAARRPLASA